MKTLLTIRSAVARAAATVAVTAIVALIGSVACALFFWRTQPPAAIFNSDLLVLVDFFHDLANFPEVVSQFQLPRIPSLVPDDLLFSAVSTAFADYHLALVAYSVAQCFLFIVASAYLISFCSDKPLAWCCAVVTAVTSVTVVLNGMFSPVFATTYIALFSSVMHFSPFILSVAAICILLRLVEKQGAAPWIALIIVSVVAFASDKLFVLTFAVPALIAVGMSRRRGEVSSSLLWRLAGALVLSFIVAILLLTIFQTAAAPHITRILARAIRFVVAMGAEIVAHPAFYLCLLVLPLVFVAFLPMTIRLPERLRLSWLIATLSIVLTLGAAAALYTDISTLRYWLPAFLWPPILASCLIVLVVPDRLARGLSAAAIVVLSIFAGAEIRATSVADLKSWHDPLADCLAREQSGLGLKDGLADYWLARLAVVSSNWRLQIEQMGGGRYVVAGNNPYWASHSRLRIGEPPVFNFIIPGFLNSSADIRQHFGPPSRIAQCAGHDVWIYDEPLDPLKDADFEASGYRSNSVH